MRRLVEALHGFDEGGIDHMDSYLGSDEEGLCGSGGYGGMAGLASFNALGLDDVRDDAALLDGKRGGKVRRAAPGRSCETGFRGGYGRGKCCSCVCAASTELCRLARASQGVAGRQALRWGQVPVRPGLARVGARAARLQNVLALRPGRLPGQRNLCCCACQRGRPARQRAALDGPPWRSTRAAADSTR